MKNKKFLPLVILVGVVALLGILLAVLTLHGKAETDTTLPLCDLAADDIDALSYAGNNVEVSLLKGSDGWLLARRCRWTRPRCRALWRTTPT